MTRSDLYFVNIWITLRCNFKCRYCYVKPFYKNVDMEKEVADNLIAFIRDTIGQEQELIINFHGGEPLLNYEMIKYIIETINRTIKNKTRFGITTNGSLLDDEKIDFLGQNFNYNLSVSIDGKRETHEKNRLSRGKSYDYDKILANAEKLLMRNKHTRIRMTFDRYNIGQLYDNIKFFVDKSFKYIVPSPDIFSKEWTQDDFLLLEKELQKIKKYIDNKRDVDIHLVSDDFGCYDKCNAGIDYYNIDPDGNIYPCTFLVGHKETVIGNCNEGLSKEKLRWVEDITSKPVKECEECNVHNNCVANRCLFTNYVTTGDFYKPNLVECNMLNIRLKINNVI